MPSYLFEQDPTKSSITPSYHDTVDILYTIHHKYSIVHQWRQVFGFWPRVRFLICVLHFLHSALYEISFYDRPWCMMIKLCCYVIRSTRSREGSPRPPGRSAPAADSPSDVKNTKFNQYLPVDLTSLNVSNSRFRKPVMFWRWRRHGVTLWRHGRGAWHNCLLLATASNVNCSANVVNHVTWLWQAGDTENFERRITG